MHVHLFMCTVYQYVFVKLATGISLSHVHAVKYIAHSTGARHIPITGNKPYVLNVLVLKSL